MQLTFGPQNIHFKPWRQKNTFKQPRWNLNFIVKDHNLQVWCVRGRKMWEMLGTASILTSCKNQWWFRKKSGVILEADHILQDCRVLPHEFPSACRLNIISALSVCWRDAIQIIEWFPYCSSHQHIPACTPGQTLKCQKKNKQTKNNQQLKPERSDEQRKEKRQISSPAVGSH